MSFVGFCVCLFWFGRSFDFWVKIGFLRLDIKWIGDFFLEFFVCVPLNV